MHSVKYCKRQRQTGLRAADEADSHANAPFPVCRMKANVASDERITEVVIACRLAVAVRAKFLSCEHATLRYDN